MAFKFAGKTIPSSRLLAASGTEVEQTMQAAQIRRMPVVDAGGKLVGIVSLRDIARTSQSTALHLTEVPGLAKTMACITQPRLRESNAAE